MRWLAVGGDLSDYCHLSSSILPEVLKYNSHHGYKILLAPLMKIL
jgi:hypothetical protein